MALINFVPWHLTASRWQVAFHVVSEELPAEWPLTLWPMTTPSLRSFRQPWTKSHTRSNIVLDKLTCLGAKHVLTDTYISDMNQLQRKITKKYVHQVYIMSLLLPWYTTGSIKGLGLWNCEIIVANSKLLTLRSWMTRQFCSGIAAPGHTWACA